jgi:heme exporter protein D
MGGYGQWVWSAYGLTVIVLAANVIAAGRRYRRTVTELRGHMEQMPKRAES